MSSVWRELKRRNVIRLTLQNKVVGWLLLQVADILFGVLEATVPRRQATFRQ